MSDKCGEMHIYVDVPDFDLQIIKRKIDILSYYTIFWNSLFFWIKRKNVARLYFWKLGNKRTWAPGDRFSKLDFREKFQISIIGDISILVHVYLSPNRVKRTRPINACGNSSNVDDDFYSFVIIFCVIILELIAVDYVLHGYISEAYFVFQS